MGLLGSLGKGLAKTTLGIEIEDGPIKSGHAMGSGECAWCGAPYDRGDPIAYVAENGLFGATKDFCCRKCATEYLNNR